jgi:hypothetical protein
MSSSAIDLLSTSIRVTRKGFEAVSWFHRSKPGNQPSVFSMSIGMLAECGLDPHGRAGCYRETINKGECQGHTDKILSYGMPLLHVSHAAALAHNMRNRCAVTE